MKFVTAANRHHPTINFGFLRSMFENDQIDQVFLLNIAKNEVYWCYKYCSKLFGEIRKEIEFRQRCCRNCKKKYGVLGERENWISVMRLPKFLSCPSSAREWIVATKLSKMGGKKKRNCGNKVAENEEKKNATFTTFSQQITGG